MTVVLTEPRTLEVTDEAGDKLRVRGVYMGSGPPDPVISISVEIKGEGRTAPVLLTVADVRGLLETWRDWFGGH